MVLNFLKNSSSKHRIFLDFFRTRSPELFGSPHSSEEWRDGRRTVRENYQLSI